MRPIACICLAAAAAARAVFAGEAVAPVLCQTVVYADGDTALHGFLARPAAASADAPVPGVLLVHEWWGLAEHPKTEARKLAEAGYAAFVVDMYGAGKTTRDPAVAGQWAGKIKGDPALLKRRFMVGRDWLAAQPYIDAARIAAQGYCFGGSIVLEAARMGVDLKGVVSLHGDLSTNVPDAEKTVTARIQVYHGGADPLVPQAQVDAFVAEMGNIGADYALKVHPEAVHAFTNPGADAHGIDGVAYHHEAAQWAWDGTLAFYETLFKQDDLAPAPSAEGKS